MEKLNKSKTFLKIAGGRMHTPHPTPIDPPVAIGNKNHHKSQIYFNNSGVARNLKRGRL